MCGDCYMIYYISLSVYVVWWYNLDSCRQR